MAGSYNKVIIVGNLGRDPEVRSMQSGDKVANLSIATSERWRDREGNSQERTEWHRVAIFGRVAEIAEKYLRKGSKVLVEGRLQTRKWQDQSGQDRFTTEVVVSGFGGSMTMLDSRGSDSGAIGGPSGGYDGGSGGNRGALQGTRQQEGRASFSSPGDDDLDDEIPF